MRFVAISIVLGLAAATIVATSPVPNARAAEDPPPADELVRRVIATNDEARSRRQTYEYDLAVTTERLDANGHVLKTRTNRAVARPHQQIEFSLEVAPDQNATAEERTRAQREMEEGQRMQATMNLKRLAPHFDYTVEGSGKMDGRDCWILTYRPKPGAPAATREEAVLNHLRGRAWIDKTTSDIVRNAGSLPEPLSLAFVASMNKLSFLYRSQRLPDGDFAPASFHLEVNVTAPFYYFEQRQTSTMMNYRMR